MLPAPVAWATIVMGAALLTPAGYFAFIILPLWLIVVGVLLSRHKISSPERSQPSTDLQKAMGGTCQCANQVFVEAGSNRCDLTG